MIRDHLLADREGRPDVSSCGDACIQGRVSGTSDQSPVRDQSLTDTANSQSRLGYVGGLTVRIPVTQPRNLCFQQLTRQGDFTIELNGSRTIRSPNDGNRR